MVQEIEFKTVRVANLWLPLLFMVVSGTILATAIFAMVGYQMVYLSRVYPGVKVADIDVSGLSATEVVAVVNSQANQYLAKTINIQVDNQILTFSGQELGLRVDADLTANKVYAVGRTGALSTDMLTQLSLLANPYTIDPIIVYDNGPTNMVLQQLANRIDQPPVNAQLLIKPDASVQITPARMGRQLHREATRAAIEAALATPTTQPIALVIQQVMPSIVESDWDAARQQATTLLSQPILLGYKTETTTNRWRLDPTATMTLLNLVQSVDEQGKTHFSLAFDQNKVMAYLQQLAPAVTSEPINATFKFNDETNQLELLQPEQPGRALNLEATYQKIAALATHFTPEIELVFNLTQPAISRQNSQNLGIKEIVAESTSYFYGSGYGRMNNIELAASKFNGIIIPPNEIFSFNHYLGEITAENGYDESLIIGAERTAVGIGGGVCQVSTTAFRAAFFGGFEILERWAHGYRVGWYETNSYPGLDATIYTPDVDFQFRNDTPYYLLIQTQTDLDVGTVTFRFYSTATQREVVVTAPKISNEIKHGPPIYEEDPTLPAGTMKQVDWAKDGLDVRVTRQVTESGQLLHNDTIFSRYNPWQDVFKVGPK